MGFLQLSQQVQYLRLHCHIQRRCRLIRHQKGRVARQRHRDHRALTHAARQLMRIAMHRFFWFRDVHLCQQDYCLVPGCLFADRLMRPYLFYDLPTDCINRRQRRHRVLKDHRNLASAQIAHLACGHPYQLAPPVLDRPFDHCIRVRDQPHHGQQCHGLARPGFPRQPQNLSFAHVKRHAVDGPHHALFRAERHFQIAHLQDHAVRTRGSSRI